MNRVMRMGIGLVALIPALGITGILIGAAGIEGEAAVWTVFGIGAVWIVATIWWAFRAPPTLSEESRTRYWAALRHAQFDRGSDGDTTHDRS